jgi:hypothetical protein
MDVNKLHEALRLLEQMIDRSDCGPGLLSVRQLLAEGLAPEDGADEVEELIELTLEPPRFGIVRSPAGA